MRLGHRDTIEIEKRGEAIMIIHPISYEHPKVLGHTLAVEGEIRVTYPRVEIDVTATLKGWFADDRHQFSFEIGPGKLEDKQTRDFTVALVTVPITVTLRARPKSALVFVTISAKKVGDVYTHSVSYREHEGPHRVSAYGLYAVLEELEGMADHTYVVGEDVHSGYCYSWPCGGAFEGGRFLDGSGETDGNVCDCISQRRVDIKLAGGQAGIRYLIDGVCHQAANRIMYPTRRIVAQAYGWPLSHYIYGIYGMSARDGLGIVRFVKIMDGCYPQWRKDPLATDIERNDTENAEVQALRVYWDGTTNGGISESQAADLLEQRDRVRRVRDDVIELYHEKRGHGLEAARRLNEAALECLSTNARILGNEHYESIFKLKPGFRILLCDPRIAELAFLPEDARPSLS